MTNLRDPNFDGLGRLEPRTRLGVRGDIGGVWDEGIISSPGSVKPGKPRGMGVAPNDGRGMLRSALGVRRRLWRVGVVGT